MVALGEATHGTREFVQFNHRLTEFLVTKMGFSLFAIEGPPAVNASAVNEYVLHGRGDAVSALVAWRAPARTTKEMLDLIEWMRRYNQDASHTEKVKFLGFDLFQVDTARRNLVEYLKRVDPEYAAQAEIIFRETPAISFNLAGPVLARLQSVRRRLIERQAEYSSLGGKQEWVLAERHAISILQSVQGKERDCHSAENLERVLADHGPEAKMIVYAHNGHIAGHGWLGRVLSCDPMGGELRKVFGKRMVTIGSAFYEGSVASGDRTLGGGGQHRVFQVPPSPQGTLAATFAGTGIPMFLLDMRSAPMTGPVGDWFSAPIPEYIMGGAVEDVRKPAGVTKYRHALRNRYDAVVFVAHSSEPRPAQRLSLPPVASNSRPHNLDFEEGATGQLPGWSIPQQLSESGYRAELSNEQANSGTHCAVLVGPTRVSGRSTGALDQGFDAAPYRGKLYAVPSVDSCGRQGQSCLSVYAGRSPQRPRFLRQYAKNTRPPEPMETVRDHSPSRCRCLFRTHRGCIGREWESLDR